MIVMKCSDLFDSWLISVLTKISFILSLLIVFHHAFTVNVDYNGCFWPQSYGWTVGVQRMMYNFSECAVPMFYFLSAYLFYRTYDGTWSNYKEKIYRRFYSLFIPYIIFCTLGYIKHLAVIGVGGDFVDYLHSLWVCDTMPLWFIRELMALSLLSPVFWALMKNKYITIVIAIMLIAIVAIGVIPYRSFLYWIPVYLMGATLTKVNLCKFDNAMNKKWFVLFSMILFGAYVIGAWFLPNGISREEMTWSENMFFIMFRVLTPIALLPLTWFLYHYQIHDRRFMGYSFFVYCMHFPVITILGIVLDRFMGTSLNIELVKYFFIVGLTYTICVLMAMVIQRFTPMVWHIINGHRK